VHRAWWDPLTHDVRQDDGSVTTAHVLIADTGTVVVAAGPMAHRGATALPRVHIVVAHREQIVYSLGDALTRIIDVAGNDGLPSDILFITGPSRTSDIEKTLVIPAQGPAALHVILIETG
jgi:L-lactate dehydrogenase complex protein LldG